MSNDQYQQQQFWSDSDELKMLQGKILIYHNNYLSNWYKLSPEQLLEKYEDLFNIITSKIGKV